MEDRVKVVQDELVEVKEKYMELIDENGKTQASADNLER